MDGHDVAKYNFIGKGSFWGNKLVWMNLLFHVLTVLVTLSLVALFLQKKNPSYEPTENRNTESVLENINERLALVEEEIGGSEEVLCLEAEMFDEKMRPFNQSNDLLLTVASIYEVEMTSANNFKFCWVDRGGLNSVEIKVEVEGYENQRLLIDKNELRAGKYQIYLTK